MKAKNTIKSFGLWLGVGLLSMAALSATAQNPVTFKIDMSVQIANSSFVPGTHALEVRGDTLGWGPGLALTSDLSNPNIYTNTYNYGGSAGDSHQFKFFFDPGGNWESPASTCGNNRTFTLAGGAQSLPVVYFSDVPPVLPDNQLTIQVDMTALVFTGAFTNGSSTITVAGGFTGWGNGWPLTNNPALSGVSSNIYKVVTNVPGVPGACQSYKFRANGGWESPASTGGNNRSFQLAGGNQTLPLVFYNDATLCDLVQLDTPVTFVLQMTNGTLSAGGSVIFDRSVNKVYINGEFLGWWAWNTGFGGSEGPKYEMTNNPPSSDYFQQTFVIPKGKSLPVTYKYGIDGFDNEAPAQTNHLRYIRGPSGVAYTMPTDRFGTNPVPPVIEQSFGNLRVGASSGGAVPIAWNGRQCVTLQTKSSLSAGAWQDVPASDGTSSTNWPIGIIPQFFRLKKTP